MNVDLNTRTGSTASSGYESVGTGQACPHCAGRLIRVPRRSIDRFLSLFVPTYRYRCPGFFCQWEGNLRAPKTAVPTIIS